MKQHNFIILVGGKSGVGKTSLINALISLYLSIYERPISYTSRPRRALEDGGEYVFSSKSEMERMQREGVFLSFDYVYENYYAMTASSISKIVQDGKIPIKEIHPNNHAKIKALLPSSISVLIKGLSVERFERGKEDEDYYKWLDESRFDVVFTNDMNLSSEQNAFYFHHYLASYIKYHIKFPTPDMIDSTNRVGYSLIANEFTEKKRVTTHNFHTLTINFFQEIINTFITNSSVLEIGPGNGWLRKTCVWPSVRYDFVEISKDMANHNDADNAIISSVANMPIASHTYDYVLSSLCDPYFYPAAICEICRVLKPSGCFAFSLPSWQWAKALRTDKNEEMTTFISDSGKPAQTYSFILTNEELDSILFDCGFETQQLYSIKGKTIIESTDPISPALTTASANCGVSLEDLDIVTVCICKKKELTK